MDGIFFNNNFLLGFLLAKDLERKDQIVVGFTASQFSPNSIVAPLLLKSMIDGRREANTKRAIAEDKLVILRRPMVIEVSSPSMDVPVILTIPDGNPSNWRTETPVNKINLTPDGKLNIGAGASGQVNILMDDDGLTRRITLKLTHKGSNSGPSPKRAHRGGRRRRGS